MIFTGVAPSQISGFGFGTLRPNIVAGCNKVIAGDLEPHLNENQPRLIS